MATHKRTVEQWHIYLMGMLSSHDNSIYKELTSWKDHYKVQLENKARYKTEQGDWVQLCGRLCIGQIARQHIYSCLWGFFGFMFF